MSIADHLTVMILSYNEEANIGRTLKALTWAKEILLVDSGSSDATLEIVKDYPQARVVSRAFDSFAGQCNFGLTQINTPWVLSLDADYELSEPLVDEIRTLSPGENACAFRASFIYRIYGHALRSALYPPRTVLYMKEKARYRDEGHGHRVVVNCPTRDLRGPIYHDDRKPLSRWVASQERYARREGDYLSTTPRQQLKWADRIRLMGWPAPVLAFIYTLFWKRCVFDGWAGWLYVMQRTLAEMMIALEIMDRRLLRQAPIDRFPQDRV